MEAAVPSSPPSVFSAEQRVWRHWYADGLPVLVAGAGCLAVAFPFLLMQSHSLGGALRTVLLSIAMVLYATLLLGQRQIVSWLKAKLTYPRTGYVLDPQDRFHEQQELTILSIREWDAEASRERDSSHREGKRRAIFVIVILLVFVAVFASRYIDSRWSVLLSGVLMGLALWVATKKETRLPWPAIAAFPLVGLYLAVYPVEGGTVPGQFVYLWFGAGGLLILLGLTMLIRYLVGHPVVESDRS
jgi:hypothetical protein